MHWRILLLLAACVSLFGCAAEPRGAWFVHGSAPYQAAVAVDLPVRTAPDGEVGQLWSRLAAGHVVQANAYHAHAVAAQGRPVHWRPHYVSTVVIAVDRAQTQLRIERWADLADADVPVGIASADVWDPAVWAALSADGSLESTRALLRRLEEQGRLRTGELDAPVVVGWDDEVGLLARTGRQLELIVPADGTVSIERGLLSIEPFAATVDEAALVAGGHRLLDGRAAWSADYSTAVPLSELPQWAASVPAAWTRGVLGRTWRAASVFENLLLPSFFVLITVVWTAVMLARLSRERAYWAVAATGFLLVAWMWVRLIKYQVAPGPLNDALWYSYYLFMLGLPLVLLWVAYGIGRPPDEKPPRPWLVMAAVSGLLLLFVATNSFHQQVFVLGESDYSYNWGYALVAAGGGLPVLWAVGLLIRARHLRDSRDLTGPTLMVLLLAAYLVGYAALPHVSFHTDLTMTVGVITLGFYALALHLNLIPNNRYHLAVFGASPLRMQLVDEDGVSWVRSPRARVLTTAEWAGLAREPAFEVAGGAVRVASQPIGGGRIVWEHDLAGVRALQGRLRDVVEDLAAANATLRQEQQSERQRIAADTRTELLDRLERTLARSLVEAAVLARRVESNPDRREVGKLSILLCSIKGRSSLFFRGQEHDVVSAPEMLAHLRELARLVGNLDVRVAVDGPGEGTLPLECATRLYRHVPDVLLWAVDQAPVTLLLWMVPDGPAWTLHLRHSATAAPFPGPGPDEPCRLVVHPPEEGGGDG